MCVRGFEGAGPFWSSVLALLLNGEESAAGTKKAKRRSVGKGLSSYQLFKAALEFLGSSLVSSDFYTTKPPQRNTPLERSLCL